MITLRIPYGKKLARPLWWSLIHGSTWTIRRSFTLKVEINPDDIGVDTTFKIGGLGCVTLLRLKRMRSYNVSPWIVRLGSWVHEDSDRFLGSVTTVNGKRIVAVHAYSYRQGIGGVTPRQYHPDWLENSHFMGYIVPDGDGICRFTGTAIIDHKKTVFELFDSRKLSVSSFEQVRKMPLTILRKRSFIWSNTAPCDIKFKALFI